MIFYEMDDLFISYRLFEPFENVKAFTTTKRVFSENKAPRFTGDAAQNATENRKQLAGLLKIRENQLIFPRQTHSCCVAEVQTLPEKEMRETDALVTNQPGLCLCIQTADCVPVLLFDSKTKAVAAVHAGWRGTVKKIVGEAVQKMEASFGSVPADILAVVGPSIGPDVYEVGEEVADAARGAIPNFEKTLRESSSGKYHFDLWEANRQVLMALGVLPDNIEVLAECTFKESNKYYSARREGIETGRLVSGIMLV
ncbi:conserved hypothetical protein [Mariniphaga anaerophila]|uniref:Purine nucleoside phosphorylase n=1 Tax=Mariniphaga anaerophila TaxID=1484053 RepID=A0A1M5BJ98_9BACT|nr:peptidoglycan editing factor PgeF [Mariniphaga anaerophila]SHF42634.1 conserved hypothetical protein [Mariniphaga anaerophila]